MKKRNAFVLAVCVCFVLAGCGPVVSSQPQAVSSAVSLASPAPSEKAPASSSAQPQQVSTSLVYVLDDPNALAIYMPQLTLLEGDRFLFIENLFEGMGYYVGTYAQQGGVVRCTVEDCSFSAGGMQGGDVTELTFSVQADGSLVLHEELCYCMKDAVFLPIEAPRAVMGDSFVSRAGGFSENCEPVIQFSKDGSFLMQENLMDGMGTYTGYYDVCQSTVRCVVHTCDFNEGGRDYAGAEKSLIYFTVQADGTLQIETDLCATMQGDVFG